MVDLYKSILDDFFRIKLVVHTHAKLRLKDLVDRYPIAGAQIEDNEPVSHDEIIVRYGEADMMVLSTLDDLSIPGKLFEYIRSGTPVLAFAVPNAESHQLIEKTGTGFVAPHDDVEAGADLLEDIYDRWRSGQPLVTPQADSIRQLERRVAYKHIFAALDHMTG